MPGLAELAYTTAGGVIGAALTNHLSKVQERRQLRATVMQKLHRLGAVRDGITSLVSAPAVTRSFAGRLGSTAVLDDGADAERALRDAFAELVVAALSAGVPRRVLDFAGGGEERALQCEIIRLADQNGLLGGTLDELSARCEAYRRETAQLLLRALWHPWRARLRTHARVRALRRDVAALHHAQETALSVLAQERPK